MKDIVKRIKRQATAWGKYFQITNTHKRHVPRYAKNINTQNTQLKNNFYKMGKTQHKTKKPVFTKIGKETRHTLFERMHTDIWLIGTWKGTWYH